VYDSAYFLTRYVTLVYLRLVFTMGLIFPYWYEGSRKVSCNRLRNRFIRTFPLPEN
jgi:hypothetical protein